MTEQPQISLQRFRRKAHKPRKKARREVFRMYAMTAVIVFFALVALRQTQGTAQRVGLGIVAVWALVPPVLGPP
jgi:hypothetical protein